jgi:glycosyltransferase involved in cell wall biosynthesis
MAEPVKGLALAVSSPGSIVWIKEEGWETPPPLAILSDRGWSAHVLGLSYDRLRRFRVGRWIRLSVALWHAAAVALGWRRATLVVGTHYAGLCAALVRSVWPPARFAVVVHSVYAIPHARDRGFLQWIVRAGLRRCDAVIVNSADIGQRILAEKLVASPSDVFLLPDGPPAVASPAKGNAKYAFSGGSSARDWEGLAAIVQATSDEVDWIVACPAPIGRRFTGIPRVRVLTDIPVDNFDALIAGASIVVAVLLQDRVAGVTLIRAAQVAGAAVIACGSPYLSEYIESGVDGVLASDIDDVVQWVRRAWRVESGTAQLREGARARAELDRRKWCDANVRLADFLERVDKSRGSTASRTT